MSGPAHTLWRCVIAAVGSLAVLAAAASFAPPRIKLIALFPAALGVAAAWLVIHFLRGMGLARPALLGMAAVLVLITLAGYATGSYLVWRKARTDSIAANLLEQPGGKLLLEQIRSEETPSNEVEAELVRGYRRLMWPPATLYLTDRLPPLPIDVPLVGAAWIAAIEFLLAWIAGVAAAAFLTRPAAKREATG